MEISLKALEIYFNSRPEFMPIREMVMRKVWRLAKKGRVSLLVLERFKKYFTTDFLRKNTI